LAAKRASISAGGRPPRNGNRPSSPAYSLLARAFGGTSHRPVHAGAQRIVKARTVHGAYGAEMRELRRLMRALRDEQRRVLVLVK